MISRGFWRVLLRFASIYQMIRYRLCTLVAPLNGKDVVYWSFETRRIGCCPAFLQALANLVQVKGSIVSMIKRIDVQIQHLAHSKSLDGCFEQSLFSLQQVVFLQPKNRSASCANGDVSQKRKLYYLAQLSC